MRDGMEGGCVKYPVIYYASYFSLCFFCAVVLVVCVVVVGTRLSYVL